MISVAGSIDFRSLSSTFVQIVGVSIARVAGAGAAAAGVAPLPLGGGAVIIFLCGVFGSTIKFA